MEMEDDDLVEIGNMYICDGEPCVSPINGKAIDLKEYFKVSSVVDLADTDYQN